MAQSPCHYRVEPTDEEENLEHWFAFIEGLPDDFERDSLRYLWNQPPTSWSFQQNPYNMTFEITVSGGNDVSGWVKNLWARVPAEPPKVPGTGAKQRHGVWTLRDPNQDLRRHRHSTQQEAIVEPRILLYCLDDSEKIIHDWVPRYPTPLPTLTLGHEHSWECVQQIWVS